MHQGNRESQSVSDGLETGHATEQLPWPSTARRRDAKDLGVSTDVTIDSDYMCLQAHLQPTGTECAPRQFQYDLSSAVSPHSLLC